MKKKNIPGWSLSFLLSQLFAAALIAALTLPGCGGNSGVGGMATGVGGDSGEDDGNRRGLWPLLLPFLFQWGEPAITDLSIAEETSYNGGLLNITATVRAKSFPEELPVDFYLVPASSPDGCRNPEYLLARSFLPGPEEEGPTDGKYSIRVMHQIFDSTTIEIDGARPHTRTLTRRRPVPLNLAPGSYRVAASIWGQEQDCLVGTETVEVIEPEAPDLMVEYVRLNNNSFRLLPEDLPRSDNVPAAAFSLSIEMGNTGIPVTEPVEIGVDLLVDGSRYPLQVRVDNPQGGEMIAESYAFRPKGEAAGTATFGQADVRATVLHLHLGDSAEDTLKLFSQDTPCTLEVTVDPENQIAEIDEANNTVTMPVQFLASDTSYLRAESASSASAAASGAIFDDCTGTPDPENPNMIFCFGPNGLPWNDSWSCSFMYAAYQFGGSAADPSYLGYANSTTGGVPDSAHFHTASFAKAGLGGCENSNSCYTPLNLLIDFMYAFPPQESAGELVFADFTGNLEILGDTLFNYDKALQIKSKYKFTWWKKSKKWTLYSKTVDADGIPLTFSAGAEGEIGIGGSLTLNSAEDTSFTADLSIGPYASLSAFGQASVGFVVCEAGVGVDLDIIDLEPSFKPYVEYFAPTGKHAPAIEMGASGPFTLETGNGDFYAFVKILFWNWNIPIVSWNGYKKTWQMFTPFTEFIGPIGEFLVTTSTTPDNPNPTQTTQWAVYSATGGKYYTWNGRLSLQASTYTFEIDNMCSVQITPDDGHSGDTYSWACSQDSCTKTVTITQGGSYTLTADTSPTCFSGAGNSAAVTWSENGASDVGGMSGHTGSPGGGGKRNLGTSYYNQPCNTWASGPGSPAYYKTEAKLNFSLDPNDSPRKNVVNTPAEGLWIQVAGDVPVPLDRTRNIVTLLQLNRPNKSEPNDPTDSGWLSLFNQAGTRVDEVYFGDRNEFVGGDEWSTPELTINPDGTVLWPYQIPEETWAGPVIEFQRIESINFALSYHSPDKTKTADPPGAHLRMTVAPDGNWMIYDTCRDAQGTPHTVSNFIAGPSNASQGTLSGGSINMTDVCQADYANWQSEYVVGAFDFETGGEYDLFVGALSPAQFTVWVDGVRTATRVVSDAFATPAQYPDQLDCVNSDKSYNPQCPVREDHYVVDLEAGYHVIEVFYEAAQANWPTTTAQVNHLRWDPVADDQYYLSFFKDPDELDCVLDPDSATCEDLPSATSKSYTPPPLLILKFDDPNQAGLDMNWQSMPADCNSAANNQVDCADSLAQVYSCSQGDWRGWFALFEGAYQLENQKLYHFEGGTVPAESDTVLDFRLDKQKYATYSIGPLNPPQSSFSPYSSSQFVAALMNDKPGTTTDRNDVILGLYSPFPPSHPAQCLPPDLSLTWDAMSSNTAYAVYFVDENGNPNYAGQGDFGTGEKQAICAGSDPNCPQALHVPQNSKFLIVGSPPSDPKGQYDPNEPFDPNSAPVGSYRALVDMLLQFNTGNCQADEPAWIADVCLNNWCASEVSIGVPGQEQITTNPLASPRFVPYSLPGPSTPAQGLMTQAVNNLLILAEPQDCLASQPTLQAQLSYEEHEFILTLPQTSFTQTTCSTAASCTFPEIEVQKAMGTVFLNNGTISNSTCKGPQAHCSFDLTVPLGKHDVVVTDGGSEVPIVALCDQQPPFSLSPTSLTSTSSCGQSWNIEAAWPCGPLELGDGAAWQFSITGSTCTGMQKSCRFSLEGDVDDPWDAPVDITDGQTTVSLDVSWHPTGMTLSETSFLDCTEVNTVTAQNTCSDIVIEAIPPGIGETTYVHPTQSTCNGQQTECQFSFSLSELTAADNSLWVTDGFHSVQIFCAGQGPGPM